MIDYVLWPPQSRGLPLSITINIAGYLVERETTAKPAFIK